MSISKLCLGTVQLGLPYGINNQTGRPSPKQAKAIVTEAVNAGIIAFDTAPDYGSSEQILGKAVPEEKRASIVFISKVPPVDWQKNEEEIERGLKNNLIITLKRLKIKTLPVYLLHRFNDLQQRNGLVWRCLRQFKRQGLVGQIGLSIYAPGEAEKALAVPDLTAVQIPFNLADKRLLENGWLKKARQRGLTILARSVFLQGLFFKEKMPASLAVFRSHQEKINTLAAAIAVSPAELALRFVLSQPEINYVLIGLENFKQLKENLAIAKKGSLPEKVLKEIKSWSNAPEQIIDPRQWPKKYD